MKSRVDPVDAVVSQEWDADFANRLSMRVLFWAWYVPRDVIGLRGTGRVRRLVLGRLLRYPLYLAPQRPRASVRGHMPARPR
jgi:hypothetical protein